jgi:hypothetical protein
MYAHISKYLLISKCSLPIKIYAHILKYLRIPKIFAYIQNIRLHPKYSLTSKIFAYIQNIRLHPKYLRLSKIYAPHLKFSRLMIYDSNKAAVEIFASYEKCMRPENRRPNSYYLGSAESPSSDFF